MAKKKVETVVGVVNRSRNHKIKYAHDVYKKNKETLNKSGYERMQPDEEKDFLLSLEPVTPVKVAEFDSDVNETQEEENSTLNP